LFLKKISEGSLAADSYIINNLVLYSKKNRDRLLKAFLKDNVGVKKKVRKNHKNDT
jgi:predicted AAA+ superfamily ATPase